MRESTLADRLQSVRHGLFQELATQALDVPFSTYRRHLTSGVQRVLGQREVG